MACPYAAPPPPPDELDEPQSPPRSPSRLDFCMQDLQDGGPVSEAGDDPEMDTIDWACTPSPDGRPHMHILVRDATAVDVSPPDPSRHPWGQDDLPQAKDPRSHENEALSHLFFIPREHPMDQVTIKPQSPIPIRPFTAQFQLEAAGVEEAAPPARMVPQRLNYPHHGLSRSALLQQKTLWNSRHEEWAEWQSHAEQSETRRQESETSDAYTGFAKSPLVGRPPPHMRIPLSGMERDWTDHPPRKDEHDIHSSIFPRVGDISALRDPYSVNMDRCFFKLPLWTLQKMLYMFDMHQRSTPLAPQVPAYSPEHVQASQSSLTFGSYTSLASGDDGASDSTLVADDSPAHASQFPQECAPSPHDPSSWNRFCGWETSWYAKWQLLIGLFQRNRAGCNTPDVSTEFSASFEPKVSPPSPPGLDFPLTTARDKVNNEADDEDDDDYGIVLVDPTFGVDFDEECERAMAFYGREGKCSQMVM